MIKFQIGNKEGTNLKDLNMGSIHNLDETATPRAKGGWSHPDETYERPGYARFSHDFTIGTNIFDLGIFSCWYYRIYLAEWKTDWHGISFTECKN